MKKAKLIMLIDDDNATNFYHQIIIENANCTDELIIHSNAQDALAYLKEETKSIPDIIFLDINMPVINGWEFLEAYKEIRKLRNLETKIFILTTSLNSSDQKKSEIYEEVSRIFGKPLSSEILEIALSKLQS